MTMRLPDWIRTQCRADRHATKLVLRKYGITTVCEEARCPNSAECFCETDGHVPDTRSELYEGLRFLVGEFRGARTSR